MEPYSSAERWHSQAYLRPFPDDDARLAFLRDGVEQAARAGDRGGEAFLRLGVVGLLVDRRETAEAEKELDRIVLPAGDRSYSPVRYATFAQELGRYEEALAALRIGFEDDEPSDLTLDDAEQYKVRRLRRVVVAQRMGGETFRSEVERLALDLFRGVQIPLRDIDPIKDDVLRIASERPERMDLALLRRKLSGTDDPDAG